MADSGEGVAEGGAGPDLRRELEARLRQQAAVAAVGQRALAGASFRDLLDEIVTMVQTHLEVEFVGYLHCTPDPHVVEAVAGVGWPPGFEHDGRLLPVVDGGLTAAALGSRFAVIVDDHERVFPPSPMLAAAGVRSSILVPIHGEGPLGLIGAHSRPLRRFSEHDAAFLSAAGNVVAVAHGRLAAEAALRHRATHDALTGLPNRVLLHDRLEEALAGAREAGSTFALLMLDLDGFKEVNDTLGHAAGDALLRAVAGRLQAAVSPGDTVARLGGDEFAVILRHAGDGAEAEATARRLQASLADAPVVDGSLIPVEASVGMAVGPSDGPEPSALLRSADLAMYRAKRTSGRLTSFDARTDGRDPKRLALVGQLRRAIDDAQLSLDYQPTVSLDDGAVTGAEALLRWNHPTRGLLWPDEFLPVVEPTATILGLSRWVLHEAVAQAARWCHLGLDVPVAVNCSARYLHSPELADQVMETLSVHGLPADRLLVEISGSALGANPAPALATVERLAQAGVGIAIDDFGAGFAALAQLERFAVAVLKIDRSFVAGLGEAPGPGPAVGRRREAIVRTVVDLGARLGVGVVAQGVETAAALGRLAQFGCPAVQGFFVSPPVSSGRFPGVAARAAWMDAVGRARGGVVE